VDLKDAISDERYENDVLYPPMAAGADEATAEIFEDVVARQREHLERLIELRDRFQASTGDVEAPAG
jgi:hypothetical protein